MSTFTVGAPGRGFSVHDDFELARKILPQPLVDSISSTLDANPHVRIPDLLETFGEEGMINNEFDRLSVKRYLKARSQAVQRAGMQY
jgi:hypothetical protein